MIRRLQYILIAVAVLVAVVVLFFVVNSDEADAPGQPSLSTDTDLAETEDTSTQNESQLAPNEQQRMSDAEATTLVAVEGSEGSGSASRYFSESTGFEHEVVATLPVPPEDKFYEGWIVRTGSVVSTGKLSQESGSDFSLIFTSEDDLSDHNQIVVTLETLANGLDNVPEQHILEGSFSE